MGSSPRLPAVFVIAMLACSGIGAAATFGARLAACSAHEDPEADGGAEEAGDEASSPPASAPSGRETTSAEASLDDPCDRKEVVVLDSGATVTVPLPCRPFDPLKDTPDPPP